MQRKVRPGYAGQILRADLTSQKLSTIATDEGIMRQYIGGTGLGIKLLYDEVSPEVEWNSPQNLLILATGPFNGTNIMGSGTFSVVTKGAMTHGATSSQASGFMGAYMKLSGFDAVVLEGASDHWVYLYLHDGVAELRDASHLTGKGTFETQAIIKEELGFGRRELSVFSIGPAGENLVRFACIVGDGGHVVAHNGVGAVTGSKRLKAIAASRHTSEPIRVHDPERLATLKSEVWETRNVHPSFNRMYLWGTGTLVEPFGKIGLLPIKNYTTNEIPENIEKFMGPYYREHFHAKRNPCWACQMHHCHILEVTEGPYKGFIGEEPEYEQWACWGSQIGVTDPGAVVMLSAEADELGIDANEGSWITGLVIECYEKGILGKEDTGGLEMRWGNVEAVKAMLHNIAYREGIGDTLAEGVKDATRKLGGLTPEMGIYTLKGTTPRAHDDRGSWRWMLDHCTSSTGASDTMIGAELEHPREPLHANTNPFDYADVSKLLASRQGMVSFQDSLVVCLHAAGPYIEPLAGMVGAVTGWDFTTDEALLAGRRIATMLKVFNITHGIGPELDAPSPRYGSKQVDGSLRAESIKPIWPQMLCSYYQALGWDPELGKPLPETLKSLGLEYLIKDLYGNVPS